MNLKKCETKLKLCLIDRSSQAWALNLKFKIYIMMIPLGWPVLGNFSQMVGSVSTWQLLLLLATTILCNLELEMVRSSVIVKLCLHHSEIV